MNSNLLTTWKCLKRFREKYNFQFHLHRLKGGCGYNLHLTKKYESMEFLDIVRPYISQVSCMRRKLESVKTGSLWASPP